MNEEPVETGALPINLDGLHEFLQEYAEGYHSTHALWDLYEAMKHGALAAMKAEGGALLAEYQAYQDRVSAGVAWYDWPGWARLLGPDPVFVNTEPLSIALRWEIWERDNFTCQECGTRRDLSVDHITPRVRGGSNHPSNLRTLCRRCNSRKGAR